MNTPAPASLADRWSDSVARLQHEAAPGWLSDLRQAAAEQFRIGGIPHRKVEAWKYTPLSLLDDLELESADVASRSAGDLPPALQQGALLVDLVDGQPLADVEQAPAGVELLPLAQGIERFESRLRPLFEGVELGGATRAFAALNTACAEHGLVVHVAEGVDAGALALRWAFSANGKPTMHQARLVLLLERGAQLQLVEQFQSAAGTANGLNLLSQVELAENARLSHTRVQTESEQAVVLTSTGVQQAGDSGYRYYGFDLGARLARHEITVKLLGSGARAELAGAFVLDGKRHADNHLCVEHRAPGCRSEQFFRGVLGGRSRGVFNGRALIQAGADGSSVRQSNANLLLSPLAEIDAKPELEIYADEVEASHGATVGQLDEAAVFYLRSRGLDEAAARRLLTAAFCHAVTDRLEDRRVAEQIAALLDAAMPGEDV